MVEGESPITISGEPTVSENPAEKTLAVPSFVRLKAIFSGVPVTRELFNWVSVKEDPLGPVDAPTAGGEIVTFSLRLEDVVALQVRDSGML
jgi:hypothetical protein